MSKLWTKKDENGKCKDATYLALEASAGSGKTFALAVRFVALVLLGENINEILALTFTKKAAAEMKVRVIKIFDELGEYNSDGTAKESEILRLRDERKDIFVDANLNISTFDSFFGRVLRVFALNAGINPNYTNDDNIKKFQDSAFLDNISKDSDLGKILRSYIRETGLNKSDYIKSIYEMW